MVARGGEAAGVAQRSRVLDARARARRLQLDLACELVERGRQPLTQRRLGAHDLGMIRRERARFGERLRGRLEVALLQPVRDAAQRTRAARRQDRLRHRPRLLRSGASRSP
jgi:hypothetical protein